MQPTGYTDIADPLDKKPVMSSSLGTWPKLRPNMYMCFTQTSHLLLRAFHGQFSNFTNDFPHEEQVFGWGMIKYRKLKLPLRAGQLALLESSKPKCL